jgi:hypothetical protein
MSIHFKTCILCEQTFELKPDKPGFANRCPRCSVPEASEASINPASNARGTSPILRRKMKNLKDHRDV